MEFFFFARLDFFFSASPDWTCGSGADDFGRPRGALMLCDGRLFGLEESEADAQLGMGRSDLIKQYLVQKEKK